MNPGLVTAPPVPTAPAPERTTPTALPTIRASSGEFVALTRKVRPL